MTEMMESLDEWFEYELRQLRLFYSEYSRGMSTKPDVFPEKLPEGEFDEQYRIFSE